MHVMCYGYACLKVISHVCDVFDMCDVCDLCVTRVIDGLGAGGNQRLPWAVGRIQRRASAAAAAAAQVEGMATSHIPI